MFECQHLLTDTKWVIAHLTRLQHISIPSPVAQSSCLRGHSSSQVRASKSLSEFSLSRGLWASLWPIGYSSFTHPPHIWGAVMKGKKGKGSSLWGYSTHWAIPSPTHSLCKGLLNSVPNLTLLSLCSYFGYFLLFCIIFKILAINIKIQRAS